MGYLGGGGAVGAEMLEIKWGVPSNSLANCLVASLHDQ